MSSRPARLILVFALHDGGRQTLAPLIESVPTLQATEAIGSLLLPAIYAQRTTGTDAEYDALAASRASTALMAQHPTLRIRGQQAQRTMVADVVQALTNETAGASVLDYFPGNHFAAPELAELLPDALAVVLVPHALALLATAYEASDRCAARLRRAEARYRDLTVGPAHIADAIDAFSTRVLILDQARLEAAPDEARQAIEHFVADGRSHAIRETSPPDLPARLATDRAFNDLVGSYLAHLAPILPRIGTEATVLDEQWRKLRTATLLRSVLAELDLARFAAIGLDDDAVAEVVAGHLHPDRTDALPTTAVHDLAMLANAAGEASYGDGNEAQAESAIRFAIELDPTCTRALNNLGVIAWQAGREHEAASHFLRAYTAEPSNRVTLDNLIDALSALGERDQAKAILAHYLSLNPDDDEVLARFLQF